MIFISGFNETYHIVIITGTVLLYLYAGAIARRLKESETMKPIHAIYIPVPSPFQALEDFIEETTNAYHMSLFSCRPKVPQVESVDTPVPPPNGTSSDYINAAPKPVGKSKGGEGMLKALEAYKEQFPNISAILIGTRRTDPHGGEFSFPPRLYFCPLSHAVLDGDH